MPYIQKDRREEIYDPDGHVIPILIKTPGELNYGITELCLAFLNNQPAGNGTYASYNAVMGALACASAEFYRRMAAPYEDKKIREAGDVYPEVSK